MVAPARDMPEDFGKYRFIRHLGSGGISTVYLVEDSTRQAVMKVASAELEDAERERFGAEARALQHLNSANIPCLLDSGTLPDGRPFLVTEWVEGSDLAALLASGRPFSVHDALLLAQAVASALACAHKQGILHLDVKPANILVPEKEGRLKFVDAKLLDFGVLGRLELDTHATRSGMVVGTPYYMSPEQLRGEALTPAADIFSLGVVTYEMPSGKRPFEGDNLSEVFYALVSKDAPRLGPPTPPELADMVHRCLDKSPSHRPPSGVDMSGLISTLLRNSDGRLDAPVAASRRAPESVFAPATITGRDGEFTQMFSPAASPAVSLDLDAVPAAVAAPGRWRVVGTWVMVAFAVLGCVISALFMVSPDKSPAPPIVSPPTAISKGPHAIVRGRTEPWLILEGALLVVTGVITGMAVKRYLARKREQITGEISELLKGGRSKKALSMTLAVQVDQVIAKCRLMDEKFLGLTMALMVKEYDSARKFDDRQKALMNAITILDKLGPKLSPWYIRHDKLVATGVSLVGVISGLATAAQSIAKLVKGSP